jgi:hypothetical protein
MQADVFVVEDPDALVAVRGDHEKAIHKRILVKCFPCNTWGPAMSNQANTVH